jgi:alkyl sulfatase BDS1-like metallo-beta-lactamase superfamily hydrolase
MNRPLPATFGTAADIGTGPAGQLAHRDLIEHTDRLERRLYEVAPNVWSMVGNGLSNQNFVEGPGGLIVIDTGESQQEMAAALAEVRQHTDAPVAAVIYTHFHYVTGTAALYEGNEPPFPIWGHAGIEGNLERVGVELSAAAGRGLVHQFGMQLPLDGPDGLVNCGLGIHFRNPEHAPFTSSFVPPSHTFTEPTTTKLAGLDVELLPAPSDADDSATIWFPELGVAINNILWPTLFNVFAIRGEEYRDPRILLTGLEQLGALGATHLLGCHGPPLSGSDDIVGHVQKSRDAIQFMWDQTVRGLNRGLTYGELAEQVQLPDVYRETYLTTQFYGVVEHHVRQIHTGLRGWFDGDEEQLLPVPPVDRANKLIAGFGGEDAVRDHISRALADDDLRWALELATWLIRREVDDRSRADGGADADRSRLAEILRTIASRTTASNLRNWCLTRALELDGSLDLTRFRTHRFSERQVSAMAPEAHVHGLRVLLLPDHATGIDTHLRWNFGDGGTAGLHVRNHVAVPTDGSGAPCEIALELATWARIVSARLAFSDAVDAGDVVCTGDRREIEAVLNCFDVATLAS